jgi:hypothetical protein
MSRSLTFRRRAEEDAGRPSPGEEADPLLSFNAEEGAAPEPAAGQAPVRRVGLSLPQVAMLLAVLLLGIAAVGVLRGNRPEAALAQAAAPATGTAAITSRPEGLEVAIDGVARGTTPLELALAPGTHQVEIGRGPARRVLSLIVEPGARASQYVELAAAPEVSTGKLEVTSDPPGAQVRVDGAVAGTTPLTIAAVAAGDHDIAISSAGGVVTRSVTVTAGATASVFASVTPASAAAGWVAFTAPVDLEIYERERLIGTTKTERLMLPAGRHELTLVNGPLEFRNTLVVDVAPGRTSTRPVAMPNGSLSVNALPWANVWIDGQPVGITPLANLPVPIGSHEVLWRHPGLGEQRRTVAVTAVSPVRIGVDFSQ